MAQCGDYTIIRHLSSASLRAWEEYSHEAEETPGIRAWLDSFQDELEAEGKKLRWGDIVRTSWLDYRNDGLSIYDGNKLILLESEPDEYGNVPHSFPILTGTISVPPRYWSNSITHNTLVWLDFGQFRDQLIQNAIRGQIDGINCVYTSFTFQEQLYYLVYDLELPADRYRYPNALDPLDEFKWQINRKRDLDVVTWDSEVFDFQNGNIVYLPDYEPIISSYVSSNQSVTLEDGSSWKRVNNGPWHLISRPNLEATNQNSR